MEHAQRRPKNSNPRESANIVSALTFWWMLPILRKGMYRELTLNDLYVPLEEHKSEVLGDGLEEKWKEELRRCKETDERPSLLRAIFKRYWIYLLLYGIGAAILELGIKMVQPIMLGKLVLYYSTPESERNITDAYTYTAILLITSFATVLYFHPYLMGTLHMALKVNVSCCSLMYRKAMRLSQSALRDAPVGQIVNLMSNDTSRLNGACIFIHDLWLGPIACIIITVIMYQEIEVYSLFGILYIISYIPFQGWLGKKSSTFRLQTAIRSDERLRLMNEIINGIEVIKMYTWEKPFAYLVSKARQKEINKIRKTSYVRGVNLAFMLFTTRTAIFISILAYVMFGNAITASKVFVVTACFNTLKHTLTDFFPYAIAQVAEGYVSVKRIEEFLLRDEIEISEIKDEKKKIESEMISRESGEHCVILKDVTAKWVPETVENTLSNLSLHVKEKELVGVIGTVGSGKSSIFYAILKELPLTSGSIEVNGVISYASQEAWIFTGTVRQNILFGSDYIKDKYQRVVHCCALRTDFEQLPHGDKTFVGDRGVSLSGGQKARINLARAIYREADIYLLDDPLSAVDAHVGRLLFDTCINGYLKNKTVILVTHQLQYLRDVDNIVVLNQGNKEAEGTYDQLRETGLDFVKLLDEHTEHEPEKMEILPRRSSTRSTESIADPDLEQSDEFEEKKVKGRVSARVYKAYLTSAGSIPNLILVLLFFVLSQVFASGADYFVAFWVDLEEFRVKNETESMDYPVWDFIARDTCIYIYTGLVLITIVVTLIRSFLFFNACMRASVNLHDTMFKSITRATMRFFNTNTTGRILNRFTKDVGNIDDILPVALIDVLQIGLSLIGIIVVVIIVNPWLVFPTIVILIIFYFLRLVYLTTSRTVKRLEGITTSPIYGHLTASLQGLTTVRAFKAQEVLQAEFDGHQDLHSVAWYLFLAGSRTFALWLDSSCILYLALVSLSFFIATEQGGNVGLAITQVMSMMGAIQWGIRQSSELENQMTSVERVDEYGHLKSERSLESTSTSKPSSSWPSNGQLEFKNVCLSYSENTPPVLKNVNFKIEPKQKIGIVGRTGAGKSSLVAALFQMSDTEGSIIIDEINIADIGLHDLRSKISIIPQEPVLFSGTMRSNLDPFKEYNDDVLWSALEDVELKNVVADLPGGLSSNMSEGGSNFSVGQRQLVCLARAIVRNNKILIMDEATANVDPKTDSLIQNTIRNKFAECTVLTIAHRLNTVMDCDKILVMDAGEVVEFDHPWILLENSNGHLSKMVERTGPAMAETLKSIAQLGYGSQNR